MNDIIVYNQKDLDKALSEKKPVIVLCAGLFVIHKSENTTFKRIGPVHAVVTCSRIAADEAGMKFINIDAEYGADYAVSNIAGRNPVAATFGGGSYLSGSGSYLSGSGSYLSGSGSFLSGSGGSYRYTYEYEFEYGRSFKGSFSSSFSSSFGASFAGSFSDSFTRNGSSDEYKMPDSPDTAVIQVFGYGINLI